jgi:adenylate kinase
MSRLPNILITGTPGTGKTTTSELLAIATNLKHVNIGDLVKQNQLHDGYDASFDTYILNEDKVINLKMVACFVLMRFNFLAIR